MTDNVTTAQSPEASTTTIDGTVANTVNKPQRTPSPPANWLAKNESPQQPEQCKPTVTPEHKPDIIGTDVTALPENPPSTEDEYTSIITVVRDPNHTLGNPVTQSFESCKWIVGLPKRGREFLTKPFFYCEKGFFVKCSANRYVGAPKGQGGWYATERHV